MKTCPFSFGWLRKINKFLQDGGSGLEALASGTLDASFCWEVTICKEYKLVS